MNPTFTTSLSYSLLFAIMALPQADETISKYMKRLRILMLFLIPSIVSVITIRCLETSCFKLAQINAFIILLWCVCTSMIYVFKKLI